MTLHPKGLAVFAVFAGALAFALVPKWGAIAIAACLFIEMFLLLGIAGYGRGRDVR